MPICKKIRGKKRQVCIGDLDTEVILQNRSIVPPAFGSIDFTEDFTNTGTVWAMVVTVDGKTYFDGVNTETNITHQITAFFDPLVTAETWVQLNTRRLDILKVESLDERNEYMKLTCIDRGEVASSASEL